MKRYEGGSLFQSFHKGVKDDFVKFVSNHLNSEVSSLHLDNRASFAFLVLYVISVFSVLDIEKEKTDKGELKLLWRHMMRKEKGIFTRAAELAGFVFVKPLTIVQAVDLKNLLLLPMVAFRRMRTILLNLGYVRLFPSELKMRQLLNTSVSHLHEAEMSVESMILQASGSDKKIIHAPVLHAKNLPGYVNAVFNKFNEKSLYYKNNRQEPVRVVFGGDKEGNSTKFHFSIVAPGVTTSAYDVKIFAIYEAADSRDNMRKVLHPFYNTIKDMQHPDFRLGGHRIKVFLNGDFKNLDLLLGHQGSGARYPSVKDEVERVHLREHGGVPHTPETCPLVPRTVDEIREHHVANVVDDRMDGNDREMAARGKLHKSIASSPVFPISSLGNVVPPVLHITLGIVLKMFNMLVEHVKSQDSASNEPTNDENNNKWQEKSEELLGRETKFKRVCLKLLDLCNIQACHQAKSENENDEELDEIAKLSTNESKLRRKKILKCSASLCLVSQFDSTPEWV